MSNAALNAIAKSAASASATYIQPGRYRFEVQAIKARDGFKGTSAIVELKVISSAPNGSKDPNPVDSSPSYVENLSDAQKYGGARFKSFLMSLVGAEEHEFANPAALAKFFDAERQAGAFLLIDAEAFDKTTAKGGTVTGIKWTTVNPSDAEFAEIERKRAAAKLPSFAAAMG